MIKKVIYYLQTILGALFLIGGLMLIIKHLFGDNLGMVMIYLPILLGLSLILNGIAYFVGRRMSDKQLLADYLPKVNLTMLVIGAISLIYLGT